jgi:ribonucleoside-triphosphate reductase (formate)
MTEEEKIKLFPVECYSRVTGYLTPVKQWNDAKTEEFKNRKTFKTNNN